jgi:hypothetical protein
MMRATNTAPLAMPILLPYDRPEDCVVPTDVEGVELAGGRSEDDVLDSRTAVVELEEEGPEVVGLVVFFEACKIVGLGDGEELAVLDGCVPLWIVKFGERLKTDGSASRKMRRT